MIGVGVLRNMTERLSHVLRNMESVRRIETKTLLEHVWGCVCACARVRVCVCVCRSCLRVTRTYRHLHTLRPALLAALGLTLCLLISRFLPLSEMMFIPVSPPSTCPQFVVIHTAKGFREVNEAEVDVFLEFPPGISSKE